MRRTTQADIARKLGLHPSSVSLALRNHASIPRQTCELVRATAEALGYKPDPMLSALAAYRDQSRPTRFAGTLAWVFSSANGFNWRRAPMYRQYYEGALEQAEKRGYRLEEFDAHRNNMSYRRLADILRARNIQGLLLCPQPRDNYEIDMPWEHFSVVTFGYTLKKPNLHKVTATQMRGIATALSHVRQLGYRRIGIILTPAEDLRADHNCIAGYAMDEYLNGCHFEIPPLQAVAKHDPAITLEWIRQHRVDAVVNLDEVTLDVLRNNGLRVPQDIGFASYGLQTTDGKTSGVCQNSLEIGKTATDQVIAMIHRGEKGIPPLAHHILIDCTWVPGETLRPQTIQAHKRKPTPRGNRTQPKSAALKKSAN